MDYKISPLKKQYLESFQNLLLTSFTIQSPDIAKLVKWKFLSRRNNRSAITYVAVDKNDHVVSQYSNIPITISKGEKRYPAMVCADMSTLPEHRGKGLIRLLSEKVYSDVQSEGDAMSVGCSNSQGVQVDKNLSGYGYHIVGMFYLYMKVVFRYRPSKVQLKTVKKLNQDFTPAVSDHFGIYKDSEYITWRYFDKPYNKYTILEVLQDSVSKGYVVLLMKKRSVYVYDIILSTFDSDLLCEVIHSVQNSALEHNLHLVIFRVLNNTFWQQLFKNLGYISKKPSEKSRYYFTVKPHIKSINTTQLFDAEKWLVQNGDIY